MTPLAANQSTPSEDYVLYISNIDISSNVDWIDNGFVSAPAPSGVPGGGGVAMAPAGRIETCIVTVTSELWDSRTKKKVLEYSAIGQPEPGRLTGLLKSAVGISIQNTVQYLKDGVTEHKPFNRYPQ